MAAGRERDILERAVRTIAEQAAKADELVDEAIAAGPDGSHPLTVHNVAPKRAPTRSTASSWRARSGQCQPGRERFQEFVNELHRARNTISS